ncbi:galactose-1-phosphate uridylyltransferase [Actinocorallia sp. A-T 12471]|uniref:galactose-1-phosphate uridylyltransferase n=1 Tax=Actinocorallia sp. A-T 12471 TaxID=3089813 RepID=UPI0029CFD0FE|nr:galactose-1-phosphate uridylyltransferase [Actinocorallia sp. A-T 12471]MDX6740081.1 galactose-1-phosphate uridylyltransferase [Actinocorallia sp. A-T 12471]
MRRTPITLADGRELIYFDLEGDPPRQARDLRDLPEPPQASEVRLDELRGEWVAIAAHRQARTFQPPASECPLDPSRPGFSTEIPGPYRVVAFENRFPSFSQRIEASSTGPGLRPGQGRCEVVCFTPDHHGSFAALPPADVRLVMDAWADRTEALSATPGVEQVFPFENRGAEIGVTLAHPHGQIYGYPYVTPYTAQHLAAIERDPDVFAKRLDRERSGGRVLAANDHWTAFVPYAARWPFEVHVYPNRRVPDLTALSPDERDAFAGVYLPVLKAFDALFDVPLMPYIAAWNQAPVHTARSAYHLHLQLFTIRRAQNKLKYLAGSESGMGAFINDIRPEQAASLLREALTRAADPASAGQKQMPGLS